jgi:hypothetical protein
MSCPQHPAKEKTMSKRELLSIRTALIQDDNPDLSYLGKWASRSRGQHWIDRDTGTLYDPDGNEIATHEDGGVFLDRNAFELFIVGQWAGDENVKLSDAIEYSFRDWKRMEAFNDNEWEMYGVVCRAKWKDEAGYEHTIDSPGLWRVESDSGKDYFREIAEDQVSEIRADLEALGFSEEEVAAAMDLETIESE